MAAAQTGHAAAYRRLLAEISPWLLRYYTRRLPAAAIEDAAQDALMAVHEKRHTYDPARPFLPWLVAIARYKWIDRLRLLRNRATVELDENIPGPDHEAAVTSATSLDRLLSEIRPEQAAVIRLVKLEGLSIEEAAQQTGQSTSLVKVNIHRGLSRLVRIVRSETHAE